MTSKVKFPVILFDGVCNLCNNSVQWVISHDNNAVFSFASLQSDLGMALVKARGLEPGSLNSVVLMDENKVWTHSDAPLEVLRRIGGFWQLAYVCIIVPRFLRNAIYNWIARNRYRWFGKRDACMLPKPEWKARFLD